MIEIRLNELLQERSRTLYWLAKEAGVRYATIWNLSKSAAGRLSIDALDRICGALDCQPGDLLVRVTDTKTRKGKR
jgi:putative transcriptional regulator